MNSFLKGFLSIFDWIFPIDNNIIQETYVMDKDGKAIPLKEDMQHSINDSKITITTSKRTLEELK